MHPLHSFVMSFPISDAKLERPKVEEANRDAPAYARIYKEMIIATHPEKPLPRSPKGTIQRKIVFEMYEEEIESLYVIQSFDSA